MKSQAWVRTLALAMTLGLGVAASAATSAPHRATPNCSRAAMVAFAAAVRPAHAGTGPALCATYTGFGGAESHIRVAPDGSVVQEPAMIPLGVPSYMQAGLALTHDGGKTWSLVTPNGSTFQPQDNAIYIDRVSSRLFLVLSSGFGVDIVGETQLLTSTPTSHGYTAWSVTTLHGFTGSENSRFTSAPAPAGQPRPADGDDVGYWCGNENEGVTSPVIADRMCYRTLDGGTTWRQASILFTGLVPQHPECGNSAESYSAGDGSYPQGAPDGSLWLMIECNGLTYLARSTDEAATFPILHRGNGGGAITIPFTPRPGSAGPSAGFGSRHELRVDSRGNLYAFEVSGSAILLRTSRDRGLHWSRPLNLTAPAVRHATLYQWQVALGAPGQVAAAAMTTRASGGWDGYLSETRNALDKAATVYAGKVNRGSAALASAGGAGDDFIDVDVGPDGSAWAAFWADCPSDDSEAFCAKSAASPVPQHLQANEQTGPQAEVVASLRWSR